jgi:NADH-quinone oxidoreductase subunit E
LLAEKHKDEIDRILADYPPDRRRGAVMPLLYLAQREYGYLTPDALAEVAGLLTLDKTEVAKLIGFYTLFHDEPGGEYRIQICTDLPCALRGAEAFAGDVCENLGIRLGETTEDGKITVEAVMCLAACDRAPMFQVQDRDGVHYHENQTVESAMELIDQLRRGEPDD